MCTMPAFAQKSKIPSWEKPVKWQPFIMCAKNILWSPELAQKNLKQIKKQSL